MSAPTKPLNRQRSPWEPMAPHPITASLAVDGSTFHRRNVTDGVLVAVVSPEPQGLHMSISFRNHRGELTRYPSWDEIAHARYELLPEHLTFAMVLPPPSEYVAVHDTTFHLHEIAAEFSSTPDLKRIDLSEISEFDQPHLIP